MSGRQVVTLRVGGALLGIDADGVADVFAPRGLTPVPMAAPDVLGVLNLRGRIVTALCLRRRLGLPPRDAAEAPCRAVGVEVDGDAYGLVVDAVESVLRLDAEARLAPPGGLDPRWAEVVRAVAPLASGLLLIADVRRLVLPQGTAA